MVTAREGRPSRVTSRPLTSPHTTPRTRQIGMITSIVRPWFHRAPITAPDRPAVEATERSISPETTSMVIGRAISAMGRVLPIRKDRLRALPKPSTVPKDSSRTTIRRAPTTVSQRIARVRESGMAGVPLLQGQGHAQRDDPVDRDGEDEQDAVDGEHPHRADAEGGQHTVDGGQQQGAESRAVDAAGAAGEDDTADHDRADDGEFVAGSGARVDVAEPGQVQGAGETGEAAAEGVRGQDPLAHRDAGEPCGLGVGAERVQLASAAEVLEVVGGGDEHRQRDQGQVGHRGDAAGAEVHEAVREVGRRDLAGADPDGVDAPDDVERAEGDHERGHLAEADEKAVEQAEADAEQDREPDRHDGVPAALEVVAGGEGADPEGGADREVDVPRDDHQRLAGGDQDQDGGVQQQVLDALLGEEVAVADLGDDDHHQEDEQDGELAHLEDAVDEPGGTGLRHLGGRGLLGGGDRHAAALPVAAAITVSSVASERGISAVRRPSCITSTRSAMPRISGRSEEIIRMATPSAASSPSSRCTSALVPTSMPRVGSSTMSTLGPVASHLARTTFCWLPPDRVLTVSAIRAYFTWSLTAQSRERLRSAPRSMRPALTVVRSPVRPMLRSMDMSITRPWARRSSGTRARPAAIAVDGAPLTRLLPPTETCPASQRSMPNTARATSVRPAPTSPARPTISPCLTSKETSVKTPSRVSRLTVSATSPARTSCLGYSSSRSRPTIRRTRSSSVMPSMGSLAIQAPSRRVVTRWQIRKISSRRCEMNRTAAPCSRSALTTPKRRATSLPGRAAGGSSMIRTRASKDSALAISTICWSAMDRPRAGRSGSSSTPRRCISARVAACVALWSIRPRARRGWRPMKMFSAIDRSGKSVGSW